jgi:hypothetical protein
LPSRSLAEETGAGEGAERETLIFFGFWSKNGVILSSFSTCFTLRHADCLRLCVLDWGAEMRIKWEVENLSKGSGKNSKVPYVQFSPEIWLSPWPVPLALFWVRSVGISC